MGIIRFVTTVVISSVFFGSFTAEAANIRFKYLAKYSNISVDGTKYNIYLTDFNPENMQKDGKSYAVVATEEGDIVADRDLAKRALFTSEVRKAIVRVQLYDGWLGGLEKFGLEAHQKKMKYSTQIEWALKKAPIKLLTVAMTGGANVFSDIAHLGKDVAIENIKEIAKEPRRQAIEKAYEYFSDASKKLGNERNIERNIQSGKSLDYDQAKNYVENVKFVRMYFGPALDLWGEAFNEDPLEKQWFDEIVSSLHFTAELVMTEETLRKIVQRGKNGIEQYGPYQRFLQKVESNENKYEQAIAEIEDKIDALLNYDFAAAKERLAISMPEQVISSPIISTPRKEKAINEFVENFDSYEDQELINSKPRWKSSDDFYSQGWKVEGGQAKYIHFHPSPWPGGFKLNSNYAIYHVDSSVGIHSLYLEVKYAVLVNSDLQIFISGDGERWFDATEVMGVQHTTNGQWAMASADLSDKLPSARVYKDVYIKFTAAAHSGSNWGANIDEVKVRIK